MNPVVRYTFTKEEKLKKRKEIEQLFVKGRSFQAYPLRWVWLPIPSSEMKAPIKMTVSVSKKRFKLAVDRNSVKRLMRETWRLNKHLLYEQLNENEHYSLMLIYTAKEPPKFSFLEKQMKKGMKIFAKKRKI